MSTRTPLSVPKTLLSLWKPILVAILLLVVSPILVAMYRQQVLHQDLEHQFLDEDDETDVEEEESPLTTIISIWNPISIGLGILVLIGIIFQYFVERDLFAVDSLALDSLTKTTLLETYVGAIKNLMKDEPLSQLGAGPMSSTITGANEVQLKVPIIGKLSTVAFTNLNNNPENLVKRIIVPDGTTLDAVVNVNAPLGDGTVLQLVKVPNDVTSVQFKNYLQAVIDIKDAALQLQQDLISTLQVYIDDDSDIELDHSSHDDDGLDS